MAEGIFKKIYRIIRRKIYWNFKREYIFNSINRRKGKCKNCGSCCAAAIPPRQHYDFSSKKCKIHYKDKMDEKCKYFPFDEKDKSEAAKLYCGYYWENKA